MGGVDYFHVFPFAAVVRFQPSTGTSLPARVLAGCQIPLQLALLTFYLKVVHRLNKFLRVSRICTATSQPFNCSRLKVFLRRKLGLWNRMYSAWIKLDDSLPWIELEEAFQTKAEAQKAVEDVLSKAKVKISKLPKQEKRAKKR